MHAHCGSSLCLVHTHRHRHRHVSCARWVTTSTFPFTSSPISSSLLSSCFSCCLSPSTSLMSWITTPRHFRWGAGPPRTKNNSSNDHFFTEAHVDFTQESLTEQRFPEGVPYCVPKDVSSSSISHDRMGNPLFAVTQVTSKVTKFRDKTVKANRLGLFWTDKGSKSSLIVKRRFKNTNSRLIRTEEVNKNWMKRSSRNKKKFIVLKQKNDVDKIINFSMNSYWSKAGIFVKLMRKVSMKWKNWSNFRVLHSTQLQEEDSSKIKILSLNSLARYRNCKMKFIVWMIQEISKMLNQYAADIPTLPVNLCLSHLIQFLKECCDILSYRRAAEKGLPSIWDTHGISGNVFANPTASSSAPYPQELNPWSSHMSEPIHHMWCRENQTPVQDQRCQSGPSARNSFILGEGDFSKKYGADQQRLQISDLHFDKFSHASIICLLKIRFKTEGMYLFTISYGSHAMDQRSGIALIQWMI